MSSHRPIVIVCALLFFSPICLFLGPHTVPAVASSAPLVIAIDGNGNFTSDNGVVRGNGSADNPYMIENWTFAPSDATLGPMIRISNTDSYVILRNLRLTKSSMLSVDGIVLDNVTNCRMIACRFDEVYEGLSASHCSHISVEECSFESSGVKVHDSDNMSLNDNEMVDSGMNFDHCELIDIENNSVSNFGIGVFGYPVYLDRCWNVTLKNNSLGPGGLRLFCLSLAQYESHMIGLDNTVDGGPLKVYAGISGIVLSGSLTGQLIVLNCSSVKMDRLSVATSRSSMFIAYVDGVSLTNSTFDEKSGSMKYIQCSNVTISNNSYSNNCSTTLDDCSNVSFTDNHQEGLYGPSFAGFSTSINQCADVLVKNNTFIEQDMEVYVYECVRLRMMGNEFPLRGLRFQDENPERYLSHVIDQTNTVGGRPVYYYAGASNVTIDASDAGQVILGNCQDVDIAGFEARDQAYCVQLICVSRVNVTSCRFTDDLSGLCISNSSTVIVTQCTFSGEFMSMAFTPSLDVRIYHNNFLTSGLQWSYYSGFGLTIEGNISWDNGYPSGGNYWKYDSHTDVHKGSSQDRQGSDGIVDSAHSIGSLGVDRYPLTRPYGSSQLSLWLSALALALTGAAAAVIVVNARKKRAFREPGSDTEEIPPPQG